MAFSVQMPALGESVTEGTVTRWLKQEGDTVEVDEPLLEVSTDKVDTEIPSPAAGVLTKIVAQEDDTVEIGGELAQIGDAGEAPSSDAPAEDSAPAEESAPEEAAEEPTPAAEPEPQAEEEAPAASASSDSSGSGTPVTMPELGESVTEGTVTRWLKAVGDEVAVDEPLLEVSTDKVDTEIPSPVAGTLLEISAEEDDTVAVGGQLAVIGSGSPAEKAPEPEATPEPEAPKAEEPKKEEPKKEAPKQEAPKAEPKPEPKQEAPKAAPAKESAPSGDSSPYVTPLVRKLASDNDVDLSTVKGTGVGGRIRKQDVLAAAEAKKAPAAPAAAAAPAAESKPAAPATAGVRPELAHLRGTTQKINRIRQITAKKTRESLQTSAQLTQTFEVDVTKIAGLRTKAKAKFAENEGVNLTYLPFFAKAVVEALKAHPNVNASINEDAKEITYHADVHLGIAVDTEQGLLSPVIHNAGDLSLAGLARAINDIATRARSGGLKPDELSGGTFTITNIGSQGALFDTPILVPPQAAMLGTGAIVKRPVVVKDDSGNESIGVRSMCYLPLTYDHRLVDGADAGRFLTTIKQRLEVASFEADLGL
ncbi:MULTISPECIES: 2-oxoglutarate dehydrogenase, E2 component, dihydrolipoamide succinyltransferase [Nocardiaceae]|jgi:2-oxoglutarate dehydrogenase E2 component (dihydrolipoamide succinyltransferase)|uniref:2-oxoglutarate dehydrogenase, E2 component, dihydrolipoamide succinyltransferase n=1 Tax=Nocardiaceae TaxID=85025 RepID=UPI00050C86C5|nr:MULTISPECIES: 2-oxoglutarate dehydrogenase, E2 component, dihydrolipoamide succinyltransferase [Rhodococcus]OZC64284.1 2-oxoglutarate dehydrogenase, E2 component, dihydrolipoamide succinyltransferase [Rhodococcus sp. 06-470-2]OZC64855.1 2-oxoglutarate dehydrogenase, E2 component, dihydrolipoamide succinyltransferase [Rhodococcus sp. 06-469-3-2]OZD46642.1 2-oxoglutarate dehydrogenase, E2 component, dihydrolipoamide succinyltransferase [Rhodococcus sp. 06-1477-1A]OZD74982.1 2-oxoglutarate dehy